MSLAQAVVLCGGEGRRMRPLLGDLPKVFAPLAGRPLLARLLGDLAAGGIEQVLLVGGPDLARHEEAVSRLAPSGLELDLLIETARGGTAGALLVAERRLDQRFFLVYGDLITALDWQRLGAAASRNGGLATLVVHRSDHPWDSDVIRLADDGRVIGWRRPGGSRDKWPGASREPLLGNSGVRVLSRDLLRFVARDRPTDLDRELLPWQVAARAEVFGYVTSEYIRDVGTPKRLAAAEADLLAGRTAKRAELAIIDRDGTLVDAPGGRPPLTAAELRLVPGAARGLRRLNRAGVRAVLATNQAAVARGLMSESELERQHARLVELLAREGAHLDEIHVCPHHPEAHYREGRAALRGPCECRKPSTGMVEAALRRAGIAPWRAVVVGDSSTDLQLAQNSGLPGVGVETGAACRDGVYPASATWRFTDFAAAAAWLAESGSGEAGPAQTPAPSRRTMK